MMTDTSLRLAPRLGATILHILLFTVLTTAAVARPHPDLRDDFPDRIDGIHVLDGSYVMDVGTLRVNITNHGLIGSQFTDYQPFSSAPSAQWPGGSGDEYLYGAGLWIGARVAGEPSVTTGQPQRELRPAEDIAATIYEAQRGRVLRPTYSDRITGRRLPEVHHDDDGDGAWDEDGLNGVDDDGDGSIDEDFGQLGDQMMVATMHDNTPLVLEIYPDHEPLGLTVVQRSTAWADPDFDDFVGLDFEIHNNSHHVIEDLYLGFYADCDIQRREEAHTDPDDLAGFYDGVARGPDGRYHRIQVAWMRDGAAEDPLPGVIGVMLLDHTTDFSGWRAPPGLGVTGFQSFTMNESYLQGGEPLSDADRYHALSQARFDRDTHANEGEDYKILISTGPFKYLRSGGVLRYRIALVMGDGLDGMLRNALQASIAQRGAWFDADQNYFTGLRGRETKVCFGDLPPLYGVRPLGTYYADHADERCTGPGPFMTETIEHDDKVFTDTDGRRCIYVNADNCEACFQSRGEECEPPDLPAGASPQVASETVAKSGFGGREHRAAWLLTGALPPLPPAMRVVPRDGRVEIYWDDRSEYDLDPMARVYDFESYRVWRVTDWTRPAGVDERQIPPASMWDLIVERDLVNTIPAGIGPAAHETQLGRNTGLTDIRYRPICLDDPFFAGVKAVMKTVVAADPAGDLVRLPSLRRFDGRPRPGYEELLPWEEHMAVLDTFFATTSRPADTANGVVGKHGTRYYRYVDRDLHNNFATYYAVTAMDHALVLSHRQWVPAGYGVEAAPGQNFVLTRPRQAAQTATERASGANIFVYPNPVTREALAEFDLQETTWSNPTGAQIVWANLPAARNTIRIYTASGDLVQTLKHDGTLGDGCASWNLVSRNRQEISSGIYLYVVQSEDSRFEDFAGRFVVVW
ncbi:MAG: T9SS type A sorting domain-containing protein [bacterium]|nr:T9SS type A sorting domain-containing protein [bacterium]